MYLAEVVAHLWGMQTQYRRRRSSDRAIALARTARVALERAQRD